MSFVKITSIEKNTVKGILTNSNNDYKIPVRVTGNGLTHFKEDKKTHTKNISINPSMINVIKNGMTLYVMMEIKLTEMFNKILIEGISTSDWTSPVVVDTVDIKELWTDSINSNGSIWNIEV
jgi:hypothetical protein